MPPHTQSYKNWLFVAKALTDRRLAASGLSIFTLQVQHFPSPSSKCLSRKFFYTPLICSLSLRIQRLNSAYHASDEPPHSSPSKIKEATMPMTTQPRNDLTVIATKNIGRKELSMLMKRKFPDIDWRVEMRHNFFYVYTAPGASPLREVGRSTAPPLHPPRLRC